MVVIETLRQAQGERGLVVLSQHFRVTVCGCNFIFKLDGNSFKEVCDCGTDGRWAHLRYAPITALVHSDKSFLNKQQRDERIEFHHIGK